MDLRPSAELMSKNHLAGDPRRPKDVQKFVRREDPAEEKPTEFLMILALVCGMVGLLFKARWAAWASCFCLASCLATTPNDSTDYKQVISTVMFAVMGLLASYLPVHPKAES